jgi:hypothetical protein
MSQFEDAIAQSERHVRESEERIARQAALVEKLERTSQERAAEEARKLLASFEKTLEVAREHLAIERKMHRKEW